jgi:hypothetical protein
MSEFKEKLLRALGDSPEAEELTDTDLTMLYADYFKSGLTFEEWLKQFEENDYDVD